MDADTSLVDVVELLDKIEHRCCPVVFEGRLVGQITHRDILRALEILSREDQ